MRNVILALAFGWVISIWLPVPQSVRSAIAAVKNAAVNSVRAAGNSLEHSFKKP